MNDTPEVGKQMPVVDGKLPCGGRFWVRRAFGGIELITAYGRGEEVAIRKGTTHFWYIGPIEEAPEFEAPEFVETREDSLHEALLALLMRIDDRSEVSPGWIAQEIMHEVMPPTIQLVKDLRRIGARAFRNTGFRELVLEQAEAWLKEVE